VVVSVVEADELPRADAIELVVDEVFDVPPQTLGLLVLFLLHLDHLSFSYFFTR
jgi:hypothetical protein